MNENHLYHQQQQQQQPTTPRQPEPPSQSRPQSQGMQVGFDNHHKDDDNDESWDTLFANNDDHLHFTTPNSLNTSTPLQNSINNSNSVGSGGNVKRRAGTIPPPAVTAATAAGTNHSLNNNRLSTIENLLMKFLHNVNYAVESITPESLGPTLDSIQSRLEQLYKLTAASQRLEMQLATEKDAKSQLIQDIAIAKSTCEELESNLMSENEARVAAENQVAALQKQIQTYQVAILEKDKAIEELQLSLSRASAKSPPIPNVELDSISKEEVMSLKNSMQELQMQLETKTTELHHTRQSLKRLQGMLTPETSFTDVSDIESDHAATNVSRKNNLQPRSKNNNIYRGAQQLYQQQFQQQQQQQQQQQILQQQQQIMTLQNEAKQLQSVLASHHEKMTRLVQACVAAEKSEHLLMGENNFLKKLVKENDPLGSTSLGLRYHNGYTILGDAIQHLFDVVNDSLKKLPLSEQQKNENGLPRLENSLDTAIRLRRLCQEDDEKHLENVTDALVNVTKLAVQLLNLSSQLLLQTRMSATRS